MFRLHPVSQFVSIAFDPVTGHHWRVWPWFLCFLPSSTLRSLSRAYSSPVWWVLSISAFPHKRDSPVPSTLQWAFTAHFSLAVVQTGQLQVWFHPWWVELTWEWNQWSRFNIEGLCIFTCNMNIIFRSNSLLKKPNCLYCKHSM